MRLFHPQISRYTIYCHLGSIHVLVGATVTRGDPIATIGLGGTSQTVPHLHFELRDRPTFTRVSPFHMTEGNLDPHSIMEGCYELKREYPKEMLTYPVKCR